MMDRKQFAGTSSVPGSGGRSRFRVQLVLRNIGICHRVALGRHSEYLSSALQNAPFFNPIENVK